MKTKIFIMSVFFALAVFLTSPVGIGKAEVANVQISSCMNGCPAPKKTSTAPVVSSIVRSGPVSVNAETVEFKVTFSETVTGVDKGDFSPVVSGIGFALVTGVRGSGSTYFVTVYTGYGEGSLGLSVMDFDLVSNAAGEKLGGTGLHNGDFAGGETYTIIRSE